MSVITDQCKNLERIRLAPGFDLAKALEDAEVQAASPYESDGHEVYDLVDCPFSESHPAPRLLKSVDGCLQYHCEGCLEEGSEKGIVEFGLNYPLLHLKTPETTATTTASVEVVTTEFDIAREAYAKDLVNRGISSKYMVFKDRHTWHVQCPCCECPGVFSYNSGSTQYTCASGSRSWQEGRSLWMTKTDNPLLDIAALRNRPKNAYLVDKHFAVKTNNQVFGPSNCGKSFWMLDMALSVATGENFLGRYPVAKGKVLYIYSEGEEGLYNRIRAWQQHNFMEADPQDIKFECGNYNFLNEGHVSKLIEKLHKADFRPSLIVIDTMSRNFGGDENDNVDTKKYVRNTDAIKDHFGATIVSVHHTGKDSGKKSRGHSSIPAALHSIIEIQPANLDDDDNPKSMKVVFDKQRDARIKDYYFLDKKPVKFDDGEDSIVFVPSEYVQPKSLKKEDKRRMQFVKDLENVYAAIPGPDEDPMLPSKIGNETNSLMIEAHSKDENLPFSISERRFNQAFEKIKKMSLIEASWTTKNKSPKLALYKKLSNEHVDFANLMTPDAYAEAMSQSEST